MRLGGGGGGWEAAQWAAEGRRREEGSLKRKHDSLIASFWVEALSRKQPFLSDCRGENKHIFIFFLLPFSFPPLLSCVSLLNALLGAERAEAGQKEEMPPSVEIALLLLGVLALETRRSASALHIQQAFPTANRTNNFAVDPVSRKVYLAAVNSVYQLNGTLSLEVEKRTGPVEDNLLCHAPQLPQAPCEHPKSLTDNHNKLLELDREQGVVVVCGSVYQGFCELRKMGNISEIAVEFPPKGERTVFPSMLNIAANHPNASTVGLVFKSHGGDTRLLVGATYTGAGTQFFPKNHSKEDLRFENTPEIAIRSLNVGDLSRLFTYDINPSEDNVFKIKQEVKGKNKLNFVRAFVQKTYSYIAFNNDAKMGHKESQPNSILARICLDTDNPRKPAGPESRKLTESYIQMPLQCGYSGSIYNRLLSVYPADIQADDGRSPQPYLFGVFSKGGRKSALCAFKFGDIEEEIRQGRRNCSNSPSSDVQVLDSVIQGSGAACIQKGSLVVRRKKIQYTHSQFRCLFVFFSISIRMACSCVCMMTCTDMKELIYPIGITEVNPTTVYLEPMATSSFIKGRLILI